MKLEFEALLLDVVKADEAGKEAAQKALTDYLTQKEAEWQAEVADREAKEAEFNKNVEESKKLAEAAQKEIAETKKNLDEAKKQLEAKNVEPVEAEGLLL